MTDGDQATADTTFVLTVRPVNDPPTLNAIADVTIDEDSATQTVSFSGVGSGAPDEVQSLVVTATTSTPALVSDLTVTYASPAATGMLSFVPVANANGPASITVTVNDGGATNNTFSRTFTVHINSINDLPSIADIADVQTTEDVPAGPIPLTVADLETPLASLVVTGSSSNPSLVNSGSFSFDLSGANPTVTITPLANQSGQTTLTIMVTDGDNASASTSFELTVLPANDAPTISNIADQTIPEDTSSPAIAFTLSDPESPATDLVVFASSADPSILPPSGLTLGGSGANRTIILTPLSNRTGAVTVTITAVDPQGAWSSRSFGVNVTDVNDAPVISSLPAQTILEDTATGPLSVVVGDLETSANALVVTGASSNPSLVPNGNIVIGGTGPNRTVVVTPAANQFGNATITLTVADGQNGTATSQFVLTVAPVNDLPTLNPLVDMALNANVGPQTVLLSGISSGAPNESQTLSVTATSSNPGVIPQPTVNYTSPNTGGNLQFTPVHNAAGSATVTVTVSDGTGAGSTASRTFTVTVSALSGPPTIADIPDQTTDEDTPLAVPLLVNDSETDPMNLEVVAFSGNTTLIPNDHISVHGASTNRVLVLEPAANLSGSSIITVIVSDGSESAIQTFNLTVRPVNDPPTINPMNDVVRTSGFGLFSVGFIGVGSGAANESQTTSVTVVSSDPSLVQVNTVNYTPGGSSGSVRLTGGTKSTGTADISITVDDGATANNTTVRTFTIYVMPAANSLPSLSGLSSQTINEDTSTGPIPFTISDAQTPADQLILSAESLDPTLVPDANIFFGGSGANRTVTITPAPNESGTVTIKIKLRDPDNGYRYYSPVVQVNAVNDPPFIAAIADQFTTRDTPTGPITIAIGDLETPATDLSVQATSSNPTLVPNANITWGGSGTNRALKITPASGQIGTTTITVTVGDTELNATRNFKLTVQPSSALPTISDLGDQTTYEATATPPIGFSVSDAETPAADLTVSATSSDSNLVPPGGFVFGGSGTSRTLTITPAAGQTGAATITVTVHDGNGGTASDSFLLTVQRVNVPPTLNPVAELALRENAGSQTITLSGVGPGAGDQNQTVFIVASSSNFALVPNPVVEYTSPNATATLRLTPAPYATGTAQITVTVNDGQPQNNITTRVFTVTVIAAPTITVNPVQVTEEDTVASAIPFVVSDPVTPAANLTVAASSSNPALVPSGNIVLGGSGANRTITLTPLANQYGNTRISLVVTAAGNVRATNSFWLLVAPVDDLPTLDPLVDITDYLNAADIVVNLTGVGPGPGDPIQTLRVTATSDNPVFISNPVVNYVSPNSTGSLTLVVPADTAGTANITVTVDDGELVSHAFSRTFTVTIENFVAPPELRIEPLGQTVKLSWPYPSSGYELEHVVGTDNPWNWMPMPGTPEDDGDRKFLIVPATEPMELYRLSRPAR